MMVNLNNFWNLEDVYKRQVSLDERFQLMKAQNDNLNTKFDEKFNNFEEKFNAQSVKLNKFDVMLNNFPQTF